MEQSRQSDPEQFYTLKSEQRAKTIEEIVALPHSSVPEQVRLECANLAKWYRPFDQEVLGVLNAAAMKRKFPEYVKILREYCDNYLSGIEVVKRTDENRTEVKDAHAFLAKCLGDLLGRRTGTKTVVMQSPYSPKPTLKDMPKAKTAQKPWYKFW